MKRKFAIPVILLLALVLMGAIPAQADNSQASSVNVTLNATVSEYAYLSFDNTIVNFANTTPAASGTIAPIGGDVTTTVTAQLRCLTGAGTLVVKAADFTDGTSDTIPITAVKTTATGITGGTFFTTGTIPWTNAGSSTGQLLGSGSSGSYTAILGYTLDNSWYYSVGSYTTTAQFILTAP